MMSQRTQKNSVEERVTAKSKPMMNLVPRCSERTPDVLPSTASESPGKTRHESQNPLSPQDEKYDRTGRPVVCSEGAHRPVVCAYSSNFSEWNVDKTWSSQEWKSDELWKLEHGDLFYSHSTRTDSLLMTMIWTLTPKQNQNCQGE